MLGALRVGRATIRCDEVFGLRCFDCGRGDWGVCGGDGADFSGIPGRDDGGI